MEHIHIRLREELERLGLSMAEAARLIGEESSQGIRDVCSGRKRASAELVAKLATAEADVLYILTGQRSGHHTASSAVAVMNQSKSAAAYQATESATAYQPPESGTAYLSREEAVLLDNYRNSSPDGQAAIKATSAAFAKSEKVLKKGNAA